MNVVLLTKIERCYPHLERFVRVYREDRSDLAKQVLANAVLHENIKPLDECEVLYLAWVKSGADQRARELSERLRERARTKLRPRPLSHWRA